MIEKDDVEELVVGLAARYPNIPWKVTTAVVDAWYEELRGVTDIQIEKAKGRLGEEFDKRPPSAMQFKRLCHSQRSASTGIRRCGRAGCPLTLSQNHQHACRFHDLVERMYDDEVLANMRKHKLDVAYLFWCESATPVELQQPAIMGAKQSILHMREQYPLDDPSSYVSDLRQTVYQLVFGDLPLLQRVAADPDVEDERPEFMRGRGLDQMQEYQKLTGEAM